VARPLISIVVPAYNAGRFLGATLESALAQTESRWECVVVDDGSTDDTFDVASGLARGDARIRVLRVENGGSSSARNHGFRASLPEAPYVTFMDSDDVWLPHALETLLEGIERRPEAIGSHGLGEFIDADGRLLDPGRYPELGRRRLGLDGRRLVRWPLDRPTSFEVLVNGNVLFPPGLVLARRRAYELAGPFDESLAGPEDWDMLIRLSRHGDLEFVDRVILHYRRHDANQGARPTTPRQAWLVRCKAFHSPENSPRQRQVARRGWRAYQVAMAGERLQLAARALASRKPGAALAHVSRLPVYAWRYARGYPLPRVRQEPLTW
jgi:glycosyltransferase involved in cell wall biosynthesis